MKTVVCKDDGGNGANCTFRTWVCQYWKKDKSNDEE